MGVGTVADISMLHNKQIYSSVEVPIQDHRYVVVGMLLDSIFMVRIRMVYMPLKHLVNKTVIVQYGMLSLNS